MPRTAPSENPGGFIEEIAETIHSRIVAGIYKPGLRLKQALLAEEFKVSRTPIREALSRLDARGIVNHEAGKSAVICAPRPREVREMYEVRAELEGLAAHLAAQWISDEQLQDLRLTHGRFVKAARQLRASKSSRAKAASDETSMPAAALAWSGTNEAFHGIIMAASGNTSLMRILKEMSVGYLQTIVLGSAAEMTMHRMTQNIESHTAILAAIEARDPTRARHAMTEHIREGGVLVTAWFERHAAA